jgi:hypothetical protein
MDIGSIFAAILGRYFLAVVFLFMCSVYCIWRVFVRLFRCFFPLPSPTPSTVEGQQQSENTLDAELTRQILGFIPWKGRKERKARTRTKKIMKLLMTPSPILMAKSVAKYL